jgi:hypothetical protein
MFRQKVPMYLKKALIKGIDLTDEELILQTIYNGQCMSKKGIWAKLPREEMTNIIKRKNILKDEHLIPLLRKEYLYKGTPDDNPFKKGGYSVNIQKAYDKRLPYTLMGLKPLPAYNRIDYVCHLILFCESKIPYEIFPEEMHSWIENIGQETVCFAEKLMKDETAFMFHKDLHGFLSRYNISNKDEDLDFLKQRRAALYKKHLEKIEEIESQI